MILQTLAAQAMSGATGIRAIALGRVGRLAGTLFADLLEIGHGSLLPRFEGLIAHLRGRVKH